MLNLFVFYYNYNAVNKCPGSGQSNVKARMFLESKILGQNNTTWFHGISLIYTMSNSLDFSKPAGTLPAGHKPKGVIQRLFHSNVTTMLLRPMAPPRRCGTAWGQDNGNRMYMHCICQTLPFEKSLNLARIHGSYGNRKNLKYMHIALDYWITTQIYQKDMFYSVSYTERYWNLQQSYWTTTKLPISKIRARMFYVCSGLK